MTRDQIFQKMLADIRLLFNKTNQLTYISGKNELTALSINEAEQVISCLKREADKSTSVPFGHLKKVAAAFSEGKPVSFESLFESSGSDRSALETVVVHLPNVGFLPAGKPPNTGSKKLVWFDSEVNTLGENFDACAMLLAGAVVSVLPSSASLNSLVTDFSSQSLKAHLNFNDQLPARFISSLLAKKFVLLCGLSGSGKTKLAEVFLLWLCESTDQFQLVAVGADWTSNENLLGYADALIPGTYVVPGNGVLPLLLRAIADPSKPYFLILDEMNLSHVERYFADFLSAIESAHATLALHGQGTLTAGAVDIPGRLKLPNNLFIIGTVNVDETTYMFSPKVLDRANVIEFRASKEQMAAFLDEPTGIDLEQLRAQGVAFAVAFVSRAQADADMASVKDAAGMPLGPRLKDDLLEVFATLEAIGGEFGFRTAKEIARFVVIHQELSGPTWEYRDALDAQVLQKLMPKLHGSARKLGGVLDGLKAFAEKHTLPLTLEKVQRMQARLKRDGFTSFAEN